MTDTLHRQADPCSTAKGSKGHLVARSSLPDLYPTHAHPPIFWEALGRAVGAFGFLEESLLGAIFALTATKSYPEEELDEAYSSWVATLERSMSDPLGPLIDTFGKALRNHQDSKIVDIDTFLDEMRKASRIRNAICHGSWRPPDAQGLSTIFYVSKKGEVLDTPIGTEFLETLRASVGDMACSVVESVTHMGWQFPGSNGPGRVILGLPLSGSGAP